MRKSLPLLAHEFFGRKRGKPLLLGNLPTMGRYDFVAHSSGFRTRSSAPASLSLAGGGGGSGRRSSFRGREAQTELQIGYLLRQLDDLLVLITRAHDLISCLQRGRTRRSNRLPICRICGASTLTSRANFLTLAATPANPLLQPDQLRLLSHEVAELAFGAAPDFVTPVLGLVGGQSGIVAAGGRIHCNPMPTLPTSTGVGCSGGAAVGLGRFVGSGQDFGGPCQ